MKTTQETDYTTETIHRTRVICEECELDHAPEECHPINAAGEDFAYCTGCFESRFGFTPDETVDIDGQTTDDRSFVPSVFSGLWLTLVALRQAHANWVGEVTLKLRDEHPNSYMGPMDGVFEVFMYLVFATTVGVMLVGGLAIILSGVLEVVT